MENPERHQSSALREEMVTQRQTIATVRLWERFKGTMANRVAVLEQAAVALLEGTLTAELRRQAEREAHRLAGSVGTFGFTEGARLAQEIEHMVQAGVALEQMHALQLSDLVVALLKELQRPLAVPPP